MQNSTLDYQTGSWIANGLSWSVRDELPFRFMISSFMQEYRNVVDVVQRRDNELVCRASWSHPYSPTKIMFSPAKTGSDLLITTADYLRVWEVSQTPEGEGIKEKDLPENQEGSNNAGKGKNQEDSQTGDKKNLAFSTGNEGANNESSNTNSISSSGISSQHGNDGGGVAARKNLTINSEVKLKKLYDFGKPNDFCAPVTGCDWNADDPAIVGCCSIDTTVKIWNIAEEKSVMQLIAHDKDVFDIAFAKGTHTFASCGADGTLRIFDLREMEHCTIVYESPQLVPLLRVAWNKYDQTYLSTFTINDLEVVIVDIRYPSMPVGQLKEGHKAPINSIAWAPHCSQYMCSAGEDHTANIWNLSELPRLQPSRFLTYDAPAPINNISWSAQHEEFIAITTGKQAQVLRI